MNKGERRKGRGPTSGPRLLVPHDDPSERRSINRLRLGRSARDIHSPLKVATTPPWSEGHKRLVGTFLGAFPDLRRNIEELVGERNKVVERWTVTGTHQEEFQELAPTGKTISYAGITISRIGDCKIVENRTIKDFMGLMQQLGAERIPTRTLHQRL